MTNKKLPKLAPLMFRARRRMSQVEIDLPDGRTLLAQYIGRGKFSNVFRVKSIQDRVYIYTKHGDLSKDILSHIDRTGNRHIPMMRYLGPMQNGEIDVYQSMYYTTPVIKPLSIGQNWKTVLALRHAHAEACAEFPGDIIAKNQCIDFNYYIVENAKVPRKIREALTLITESAQDWGKHYLFDDFKGRNLGLDKNGRLVFIDPVFDAGMLQKRG